MTIRTVGLQTALFSFVMTAVVSCASHAPADNQVPDANVITSAEIDSTHLSTAYDVIHKLRPQYLMSRGKMSLDPAVPPALPRVYVDDQFYGDASTLRGLLTGSLESIRYLSSSSAQYKYGHDNAAGVIAIVTKH
jgi:hypothetical protein